MAGRIFISHIHEEDEVAEETQELIEAELNVPNIVFRLSDQWAVRAGENWLERIRQEITSATAIILMLSRTSVERPWVNFEAGAAWMRGIPLICACYGGLKKGDLPKPYSVYNALDLETDAYYLVSSVAAWLQVPCPPPPPMDKSSAASEVARVLDPAGEMRRTRYRRHKKVVEKLSWEIL